MIVTVNSQLLAAELRQICKIVPSKPAIVALSYVVLSAEGDQFRLYATDLEIALDAGCRATVERPGSAALPAVKLLAFVEQFTNSDVRIVADKQVTIECGAFKSRIQTLSVEEFPQRPDVDGSSCMLDGMALRMLIARTRYAVSAGGSKYVLKGALLTLTGQTAAMVATDAKRLALATTSRTGPDQRVIVPAKTLDVLASGDDGDIELTVGPKHLFFALDGRMLTSRTIDAEYPKYERIIPRNNDKIVAADRMAFTAALRRVTIASDENQAVWITVAPGRMEMQAQSNEVGSAVEGLDVRYDGPLLKVCANGEHVLDFLNAASGMTITMALKDASSAALFMDGDDHIAVIMLLRG